MSREQNAGHNQITDIGNKTLRSVWHSSGNNTDKSKLRSRRNEGQTEVWELLLPPGPDSFALQLAIQKHEDQHTQNYNFACCFIWVWNLVSHVEKGTWAEGCPRSTYHGP
jgi:hypothetical protein